MGHAILGALRLNALPADHAIVAMFVSGARAVIDNRDLVLQLKTRYSRVARVILSYMLPHVADIPEADTNVRFIVGGLDFSVRTDKTHNEGAIRMLDHWVRN